MNLELEIAAVATMMRIDRLGPKKFFDLYQKTGSCLKIIQATPTNFNPERELKILAKENIEVVFLNDPNYPPLLKIIHDPPVALFVRGNSKILTRESLAIVGSRRMSDYGAEVTKNIAEHLASENYVIVSGLAMGIDATAHRSALNTGTVAVMAGGTAKADVSPRINFLLGEQIIANGGAIISEYPPGVQIQSFHFPKRNRIIAGLAKGVIVVEADFKSGALITANLALSENREVFAVPGPITSSVSRGTNFLIQNGAMIILEPQDINYHFNPNSTPRKNQAPTPKTDRPNLNLTATETLILNVVQTTATPIDVVVAKTMLNIAELTATLTGLELKGCIKNNSGVISALV